MGVCNCSMYCCTLLYVHYSIAIILMGKRELIALLNLSSWCLVMVERLFLTVPRGCLQFVIVVFPDHTHLLFLFISLYFHFNIDLVIYFSTFLFCFFIVVYIFTYIYTFFYSAHHFFYQYKEFFFLSIHLTYFNHLFLI